MKRLLPDSELSGCVASFQEMKIFQPRRDGLQLPGGADRATQAEPAPRSIAHASRRCARSLAQSQSLSAANKQNRHIEVEVQLTAKACRSKRLHRVPPVREEIRGMR